MSQILTQSVDSFMVIIEQENSVEYVHVKRSDSETINKDSFYFRKGDEVGALKFLNSLAALIGIGSIIFEENKKA